ncbi:MAG: pyruvate formate lyase-activating protein [Oscillospiraceae bacterium]|jgi:pyruvate formate lyase activating enzyme|nr:pyruvate formate lyase-activating protein [Oscillospiraceae bacterium]
MYKDITGVIHSIESLGGHDGPGLRVVVFFQGCPLRCIYCHNPDTWESCGNIRLSVDELIGKILRYKPYFSRNGGVTASGGEPLLQAEFIYEFFKRLKEMGIHTALDTAGSIVTSEIPKLLTVTDQVILDIKHAQREKYGEITGDIKSYDTLMEFLSVCKSSGAEVVLRQVIVPGITDDENNIKELNKICKEFKVSKAELIPYHTAGIQKWDKLKINYKLRGVKEPDDELIRKLNSILYK